MFRLLAVATYERACKDLCQFIRKSDSFRLLKCGDSSLSGLMVGLVAWPDIAGSILLILARPSLA